MVKDGVYFLSTRPPENFDKCSEVAYDTVYKLVIPIQSSSTPERLMRKSQQKPNQNLRSIKVFLEDAVKCPAKFQNSVQLSLHDI
jgi:hypothetical protein